MDRGFSLEARDWCPYPLPRLGSRSVVEGNLHESFRALDGKSQTLLSQDDNCVPDEEVAVLLADANRGSVTVIELCSSTECADDTSALGHCGGLDDGESPDARLAAECH